MIPEGWTAHDGSECPVPDDIPVAVMFRDGEVDTWGNPDGFNWSHNPEIPCADIIAYQEVK